MPLLARASGREMLGEALNVLKAAPAGERDVLASELMAQVQARAVGGAWQATEMAGANGARAFVGEYHTLVSPFSRNRSLSQIERWLPSSTSDGTARPNPVDNHRLGNGLDVGREHVEGWT
jgi:hypothetical protein